MSSVEIKFKSSLNLHKIFIFIILLKNYSRKNEKKNEKKLIKNINLLKII